MRRFAAMVAIAAVIGLGTTACGDADSSSSPVPKVDRSSGPAFKMLQGKLTKIEGEYYFLEDYEGREHKLHVGKDTKILTAQAKKPGDSMRAEVTEGNHANSIQ